MLSSIYKVQAQNNITESMYESQDSLYDIDLDYEKYAPIVFFHPDEETYPCSVEKFLENACIRDANGNFLGGNLLNNYDTWDIFGGNMSSFRLTSLAQEGFDIISNNKFDENTPVYVNLEIPETNTSKFYQYWFFYPYNGWVSRCFRNVHRHEGDWEHITVQVNKDSEEVEQVFMSAHGSRESRWISVDKLSFTDNHVHVYSARNSHACYPNAGQHIRGPVIYGHHIRWLGLGFLDDFTGKHPSNIWYTNEHCYVLPNKDDKDAKVNTPWFWFGGYWGSNEHIGSDKRGPRGPFYQSSYNGD